MHQRLPTVSSCFLGFLHALFSSHLMQLALMMHMKIVEIANSFSSQAIGIEDAHEDC